MHFRRRRGRGQSEATLGQRRREDAAPRLCEEAPNLQSLRLTFSQQQADGAPPTKGYIRPIVVATAPAHFEVRCLEPTCSGRHDLTEAILHALRRRVRSFEGVDACRGATEDAACDRTLTYAGEASYRAARAKPAS